jgi:hypothetical protein
VRKLYRSRSDTYHVEIPVTVASNLDDLQIKEIKSL